MKMEIIIGSNDSKKDYSISLPIPLYSNIDNPMCCKLKVGMSVYEVHFTQNYTVNTIKLSKYLLNELNLSIGLNTNAKIEDNVLSLGPVIGVFTSNGSVRKVFNNNVHFRIKELERANREANTILYYFSVNDLFLLDNKINGTYYNKVSDCWDKKMLPLPDVLYDRGGGTLKKQRVISSYIRKQFDVNNNIKRFNSEHYFDKWYVYKNLNKEDDMSSYLPLTIKYETKDDLEYMFSKSNSLYFKDRFGSNGLGVIRINKNSDNTYDVSFFNKKLIQYRVNSLSDLTLLINNQANNKKIIIQTAIELLTFNDCVIDLRATVQRDKNGKIVICAFPVRMGVLGSPITSTRSGSNVFKFENFFKEYLHYDDIMLDKLRKRIESFLITSYKCIEKYYGYFGEIGIDFALDKEENLWFIECNAKPGKDTLYKACESEVIKKAFLNPLHYAMYITNF